MRILFISQCFEPEPFFKGLPFAKELMRYGHEVEVLTGFPNYPEGKVYKGYHLQPYMRETIDGIPIVRVALYPSHDSSAVRRIANYASFALSSAILGSALVRQPDVAYVYHPPATIAVPAMVLQALRHVPFVYDIQDMWPDTLVATGMFNYPVGIKMVERYCQRIYERADRIVVPMPGFNRLLTERKVPAEKIKLIYNWCEEHLMDPLPFDVDLARELGLLDRFNVVFAGNMGKAQALESVLEAAAMVSDRVPKIQFVFVGGGICVADLKMKAKTMALNNVRFLERMPMSEISRLFSLADALLVHLKDDPLFEITIPSKTQAYLCFGRPILMAVKGDAANLIKRSEAGITCLPENPKDLADAVVRLYNIPVPERERMGQNGRAFYKSELSLQVGAKKFEALFQQLHLHPPPG